LPPKGDWKDRKLERWIAFSRAAERIFPCLHFQPPCAKPSCTVSVLPQTGAVEVAAHPPTMSQGLRSDRPACIHQTCNKSKPWALCLGERAIANKTQHRKADPQ